MYVTGSVTNIQKVINSIDKKTMHAIQNFSLLFDENSYSIAIAMFAFDFNVYRG